MRHKEYIYCVIYPVEYSHCMGRFLIRSKQIKGFVIVVESFTIDASLLLPINVCIRPYRSPRHQLCIKHLNKAKRREKQTKSSSLSLLLLLLRCIYIYTIYRGYCIVLCRGQHVVYTYMNIRDHQLQNSFESLSLFRCGYIYIQLSIYFSMYFYSVFVRV